MLNAGYWIFRRAFLVQHRESSVQYRHHFLARRVAHLFWTRMQQMNSLLEQTPTLAKVGWRFCFQDELNFLSDVSNVRDLQGKRHPVARSHCVDCDREFRFFPLDNRLLKEESFSAAGRLHLAVCPFRNKQVRVHRNGDALQLIRLFKSVEELSKGAVSHLRGVPRL